MALRHSRICNLSPVQLVTALGENPRKVKLIDCRSFLEYNDNHIVGAVNICCSKLIKRRLQQEKISLKDLLLHCRIEIDDTFDIVVYDQRSQSTDDISPDSFIYVLLKKLILVFERVHLLSGGFIAFHALYPEFAENKVWKYPGLTALSQPCLPTTSTGPTRILPFLYLGSEEDANNRDLLQNHNITYELNVSNKCPKPEFISDGRFMRIPVNDSHNEKLLPHFYEAFQFVDKARESNENVLIHCLAGISRSPTVAIAYVMRHLQMNCEDAYRYVKSKRTTISPNFNFLGQLLEYEKQLIQENIIDEKKAPQSTTACTTAASQPDFLMTPTLSPPPVLSRPAGKRLNLSLRFSPFSESTALSSPKDASPTTALARLQFDKPLGKENRTGSTAPNPPNTLSFVSLSRPTRLVKEQNVTSIQEEEVGQWESMSKSVTHHSVSISISKGFKCRKSSLDQQMSESSSSSSTTTSSSPSASKLPGTGLGLGIRGFGCDYGKKFKIHKIHVEGSEEKEDSQDENSTQPVAMCSTACLPEEPTTSSAASLSPVACYKRDFSRSDSVSTSGIGSEISENELQGSGSWEMSESNFGDDGVFSESYGGSSRSPRRQLQLWSSDSGHWSSTDEGVSCSSSQIMDVPGETEPGKSPEKRKCPSSLFPNYPQTLSFHDKRKSYAAGENPDVPVPWSESESRRPKRWSISEEISNSEAGPSSSSEGLRTGAIRNSMDDVSSEDDGRGKSPGHLTFDNHWFNLLSGSEMSCCERQGDGILYRVHSCPGFLGCRDWLQLQQTVSDSPPDHEPISDSVLLKMRSCGHRSHHERSFEHSAVSHHPWSKNRFSFGHVDYDELLSKLRKVQETKTESSHSSSSTLASSSFSIVVQ